MTVENICILILVALICFCIGYFISFSKIDKKVEESKQERKTQLDSEINLLQNNIDSLTGFYNTYEVKTKTVDDDFKKKKKLLQEQYEQMQKDLKNNFLLNQADYQNQIEEYKKELLSFQKQKAATIEANLREQVLKDNPNNFVLGLTDDEKHDVEFLNQLRPKLVFPQVVGKIIWSTFIKDKLKTLSDKLLDETRICGIYKITNIRTSECYIGQSVDVRKRWQQHCKEGVGAVSAFNRNQLYTAMQNYGIYNFSFELLEKCNPEELNQKEAFYIQTYNSNKFGYNQTRGNS